MAAWARGVGEGFELALLFFLGSFCRADLVELGHGGGDAAGLAQDAYFQEAGVYRAGEVGDLFKLKEICGWPVSLRDSKQMSFATHLQ